MSSLINLLLVSGKFLTKAAAKTLQDAFCASIRAREYLALEYDRSSHVIDDYEHMLDLIQDRGTELSQIIGSEFDIHVAVINSDVKVMLESYFRSLNVPFVQLNKPNQGTAPPDVQRSDRVFLSVNAKSNNKKCKKNTGILRQPYSTHTCDKDLEFLKQKIRDKFKKLLETNADYGRAKCSKEDITGIDVTETIQEMTNTQKYILQDLDSLIKCLKQIEELREYLRYAGIKNNSIHLVVMNDANKTLTSAQTDSVEAGVKIEEVDGKSVSGRPTEEDKQQDIMIDELITKETPQCLGDSYGGYLSEYSRNRWRYINANKALRNRGSSEKKLSPIYVTRKRKRDGGPAEESGASGEGKRGGNLSASDTGILKGFDDKIKNSRPKRLYDRLMNLGLNEGRKKSIADNDVEDCETSSKKFKYSDTRSRIERSTLLSALKFSTNHPIPGSYSQSNVPMSVHRIPENDSQSNLPKPVHVNNGRLKSNIVRKLKKLKEYRESNENYFRKFEKSLEVFSYKSGLNTSGAKQSELYLVKEKTYRRMEKRIKKLMKSKQLMREQQFVNLSNEEFRKMEARLDRMKDLHERVLQECKIMFINKRQFQRLEKQLEVQLWRDREREEDQRLLLLNQKIFEDVEKQIARRVMLGQLQLDVELASRVVYESHNAFNKFQRRMLHNIVNNIENSSYNPIDLSLLCGKEIDIMNKTAFDMIVETMQLHNDNVPSKPVDNEEIISIPSEVDAEIPDLNIVDNVEQNQQITDKDIEFLTELDGLKISIIRMPEEEVITEDKPGLGEETVSGEMIDEFDPEKSDDCSSKKAAETVNDSSVSVTSKIQTANIEREMTEEIIEVNEKAFKNHENIIQTVQLIDQKPKFTKNTRDDESSKLLNHGKGIIGDNDKRKISTAKTLVNRDRKLKEMKIMRSNSDVSVRTESQKQSLSLYDHVYEKKDSQKQVKKSTSKDSGVDTKTVSKIGNLSQPLMDYKLNENEPTKTDVSTEANEKVDTNLKEAPKMPNTVSKQLEMKDVKHNIKSDTKKADTKVEDTPKKNMNSQKFQTKVNKVREPKFPKLSDIYKTSESDLKLIDENKVLKDVTSRQKPLNISPRKEILRKVMEKQRDSTITKNVNLNVANPPKKVSTPEKNSKRPLLKGDAIKQNKFISRNTAPAKIDKNLEKKLVKRDISAKSSSQPINDYNQPQLKYKFPETSKHTKILEQIKVKPLDKLQKMTDKRKGVNNSDYIENESMGSYSRRAPKNEGTSSSDKLSEAKLKFSDIIGKSSNAIRPTKHPESKPYSTEDNRLSMKRIHTGPVAKPPPIAKETQTQVIRQGRRSSIPSGKFLLPSITENASVQTITDKSATAGTVVDAKPVLITSSNCANIITSSDTAKAKQQLLDDPDGSNGPIELGAFNVVRQEYLATARTANSQYEIYEEDISEYAEDIDSLDEGTRSDSEVADVKKLGNNVLVDVPVKPLGEMNQFDDMLPDFDIELMDDKEITLLFSTFPTQKELENTMQRAEDVVESRVEDLNEFKSEIASEKFKRKPWGTNVINQVPSHMKRIQEPDILPQTTIWNNHPRPKIAAPPKPKTDNKDKKYRFESKEIVMGNKVTRVTYLVEE